jgi:hypothetical protein
VNRLTCQELNHKILGRRGRLLQFITRSKKVLAYQRSRGFAGTFPFRES